MTTWYEVNKYSVTIKPVEVVKETAKSISIECDWWGKKTIHQRRIGDEFFKTREEAKAYLEDMARRGLEAAKHNLDQARSKLELASAL